MSKAPKINFVYALLKCFSSSLRLKSIVVEDIQLEVQRKEHFTKYVPCNFDFLRVSLETVKETIEINRSGWNQLKSTHETRQDKRDMCEEVGQRNAYSKRLSFDLSSVEIGAHKSSDSHTRLDVSKPN